MSIIYINIICKEEFFDKDCSFFVLISGFGMTLTENLMAADYVPVLVFGSKNSSGNGQFDYPVSIAIDTSGNIFVADSGNHRIQKFNSAGMYQSQFGSYGTGMDN